MNARAAERPVEQAIVTREAAEALCHELEATMENLLVILEAETDLVREGSLFAAGDLQPEKSRLAADYVQIRNRMKSNGIVLGRYAPEAVEHLRARHEEFESRLKINLAVLATAREVAEDIIRNVSGAVGRAAAPNTYGRGGATASGPTVGARGIAVDRKF